MGEKDEIGNSDNQPIFISSFVLDSVVRTGLDRTVGPFYISDQRLSGPTISFRGSIVLNYDPKSFPAGPAFTTLTITILSPKITVFTPNFFFFLLQWRKAR